MYTYHMQLNFFKHSTYEQSQQTARFENPEKLNDGQIEDN